MVKESDVTKAGDQSRGELLTYVTLRSLMKRLYIYMYRACVCVCRLSSSWMHGKRSRADLRGIRLVSRSTPNRSGNVTQRKSIHSFRTISNPKGQSRRLDIDWQPSLSKGRMGSGAEEIRSNFEAKSDGSRSVRAHRPGQHLASDAPPTNERQSQSTGQHPEL